MALWRVGDKITEKFALFTPATGARITSGASFSAVANDGAGNDISSQIVVIQLAASPGIYTFNFTPLQEGTYVVSILETTTNQQILGTYVVGSSVTDHIWNLGNQGQAVAVSTGGGGFAYTGTVATGGVPQNNVLVRVYQAQDPIAGGADGSAVTDLTQVLAQATTDINGHFTIMVSLSYYTLLYFVKDLPYQSYIRWSTRTNSWVISAQPIPTSAL